MSVYLITGISGYLGGRILQSLKDKPDVDRIIGVDVVEPPTIPDIVDFHPMDVRDEALRELARAEKVEVFIHLAFVLNPIYNLVKMHSIDVWGADNVLQAAAACKATQVFVTSSASAYGALPDNPEPLIEDHPLRAPRSYQYAYDKAKIDRMCRGFMGTHPEINMTIVRPCIVLGPNVDNYISRGITMGLRFHIDGQDPTMQFVHEDDVARACLMCIEQKARGTYNLVGKDTVKMSEMWQMMEGKIPPVNFRPWLIYPLVDLMWQLGVLFEAPSGQLDFMRWPWWCSGEKIKNEVGFEPKYNSRETLKQFLDANEQR